MENPGADQNVRLGIFEPWFTKYETTQSIMMLPNSKKQNEARNQ